MASHRLGERCAGREPSGAGAFRGGRCTGAERHAAVGATRRMFEVMARGLMEARPDVMLVAALGTLPMGCGADCPIDKDVVHDVRETRVLCVGAPGGDDASPAWTTGAESATATASTEGSDLTGSTGTSSSSGTSESSGLSEQSASFGSDSPACGNAVWEGGEECDDGNIEDEDACLSTCVVAKCGDGFVWAGVEHCDDGNFKNGDGCDVACGWEYIMFATEKVFASNLGSKPVADALCQDEATAAGLSGKYVAWLSADWGASVWDALPHGQPLRRTDGALIVASAEDLALAQDTVLNVPVSLDAYGNSVEGFAWTGTLASGDPGADCSLWAKTLNVSGLVGDVRKMDARWTHSHAANCFESHRLYCVRGK